MGVGGGRGPPGSRVLNDDRAEVIWRLQPSDPGHRSADAQTHTTHTGNRQKRHHTVIKIYKKSAKPKQKHSNHQGFVGLCSCSYRTLYILSREHEQEVILCVHAHHRIHFLGLQQILGWAGRGMFMKYYILPTVLSNLFEPAGRLRNYLEAAIRPPPTIRGSHRFLVRRRRPPLPQ